VVYLPFYELLDAEASHDGWKRPRVSWSNYWSPDPAVWRAQAESPRPSGGAARRLAPIIPPDSDEDFDVAWVRTMGGGRGAWRWWLLAGAAGAAVLGAIVLGVRLGLRPADTSPPPPEATPQPSPVAAPEPTAAAAVRRAAVRRAAVRGAIAEYRSRESLVAKHQMTCDDLARGLADVDDQWLHYTLAAPGGGSGSEDTTLATPEGRLAADVETVEADFERSGCPRP